jgi:hypothetical protein
MSSYDFSMALIAIGFHCKIYKPLETRYLRKNCKLEPYPIYFGRIKNLIVNFGYRHPKMTFHPYFFRLETLEH